MLSYPFSRSLLLPTVDAKYLNVVVFRSHYKETSQNARPECRSAIDGSQRILGNVDNEPFHWDKYTTNGELGTTCPTRPVVQAVLW